MAKAAEDKNLKGVEKSIEKEMAEAGGSAPGSTAEISAPAKAETDAEAGKAAEKNAPVKKDPPPAAGRTAASPPGTKQTAHNTQLDPESLLDKKLKELSDELARQKLKLAQLSQESKILEADKAALEALIAEFTKILDKYAASLDKLGEQKDEMNRYTENKTPMIEVAVQDHLDDINEIIVANDQIVSDLEAELAQLKTAWEDAQDGYTTAKEAFDTAKNEFDSLKTRQKSIEDDLKTLQQLRKTIESEEELNHFGVMYFLIGEFNTLLSGLIPRLVTRDALETALINAWVTFDTAQYELRKHESDLAGSKKNYEDKLAELETAQKNKRDNIIAQLSQIAF
ncbi:MAG: hypothetical protein KDH97_00040 [Calditrichaeota bacterium]|nr:hypothetical protein [Calditrichota bacterium]MCB9088570.1 hypothetical protein [Calditrichia bacterium]MCB0288623.1 hypothetical protein [Calditrichota bacterium]MCB0294149.1 hypothetical protein [Calditrichota bacterium]MCB0302453.1 hypothetical protein [Calditrichota bacterium]